MPLYSTTSSGIVQTVSNVLAVDASTTSLTFVDLLTQAITVGANNSTLLVSAVGSIQNTNNGKIMQVRLLLDSTDLGGQDVYASNSASGNQFALFYRTTGVSAGSHTIKLQWQTSGNTAQCRPVTQGIDKEGANIIIQELTV